MADLRSDEHDRQQLLELLPMAANRTLTAAQQARLEAGLARHPELRHELRWLQALRETVQAEPLDPMPAGDLGWSKLEQRLAAEGPQKRTTSHRAPRSGLSRLRDWLEPNFMPVLATACVLMVAQAVLIGTLVQQDDTYSAAGGNAPVAGTASGVLLHVTVRPATTELQLREALGRFKASIVQGPTALGVYTLRADAPDGARALAQRLTTEAGGVFDSASPAEGP
jgi:hypothetical protein